MIRILDKSNALLQLSDLGFGDEAFKRYERSFRKPYGAILVTGPTGSGKSTTLYATLNIVNQVDRNIITVEDPVEYRLPGVNQIQVNPKAGLTFASALRSILRADPDIILVGEIRDRETAMIAVESALTGHLVLSVLHTNDAPSAITRLTEMEVETFLVASARRLRRGPAARAAAVREVQGGVRARAGRAARGRASRRRSRRRSRRSSDPSAASRAQRRVTGGGSGCTRSCR